MKIANLLYMLGACAVLAGAILKMFQPQEASLIFLSGAILFAVMQFITRYKSNNFTIRRLVWQQQLGGVILIVAGILMFTHTRNEWIIVTFIAALIELYTAFRISQEINKER